MGYVVVISHWSFHPNFLGHVETPQKMSILNLQSRTIWSFVAGSGLAETSPAPTFDCQVHQQTSAERWDLGGVILELRSSFSSWWLNQPHLKNMKYRQIGLWNPMVWEKTMKTNITTAWEDEASLVRRGDLGEGQACFGVENNDENKDHGSQSPWKDPRQTAIKHSWTTFKTFMT